jgi:hypothetical protein
LPKTFEKIIGDMKVKPEYIDFVKNSSENTNDVISNISDLEALKNMAEDYSDGRLVKALNDTQRDIFINATEDLSNFFMLYDSPPPCKLQIGQFFYHPDMIVESVNVQFSDEKTEYGPIYVDISLEMSSRKIMQGYADTGLVEISDANKGRIIRNMGRGKTPQTQAQINEAVANASNTQAAVAAQANPVTPKNNPNATFTSESTGVNGTINTTGNADSLFGFKQNIKPTGATQ